MELLEQYHLGYFKNKIIIAKLAQKLTIQRRQSILSLLRNLVSKTILRAIDIILSPCCTSSIESVEVSCGEETGSYDLIIHLSESVPMLGKGFASIQVGAISINDGPTPYNDTTIINATVQAGRITPGTYTVNVGLILQTGGNRAVATLLEIQDIVFPDCG